MAIRQKTVTSSTRQKAHGRVVVLAPHSLSPFPFAPLFRRSPSSALCSRSTAAKMTPGSALFAGLGVVFAYGSFSAVPSRGLKKHAAFQGRGYFAYSTAFVSRNRLTLICPGYSSSCSILWAISRARRTISSSLTSSGLTIMRISRPAWMA